MRRLYLFIQNHFDKKIINNSYPFVFLAYYALGMMSYVMYPWPSISQLFISTGSLAVIVRVIMLFIIGLYSLVVLVVNKVSFEWKWFILFIYILLFTLISLAISPAAYDYVYEANLYQIMHKAHVEPGFGRVLTMYFSSISDFFIAFCFLFILPHAINKKRIIIWLLIPIVILCVIECLYSIIFERQDYIDLIRMVDPQYSGYTIKIRATFVSKQDWGAFLTIAFISSMYVFWTLHKYQRLRLAKWLFVLLCFVFYLFTIMSLCKTAIVSETLVIIVLLIRCIFSLYKTHTKLFIPAISLFVVLMGLLLFIYFSPLSKENVYLNMFIKMIDEYILDRISPRTISGRTEIWLRTIENLRTYNVFFGLSKSGSNAYSQVVLVQGQTSVHNGLAYFFLSYGAFATVIYLLLNAIVIRDIFISRKISKSLFALSISSYICATIFTLVESEVFIVSSAIPIFIFNILLCVYLRGFVTYEKD